jgi:hypothetical protein
MGLRDKKLVSGSAEASILQYQREKLSINYINQWQKIRIFV